ncbi:MAG: hypothetical protein WCO55_01415 [Candidatus Falkowbacteria bacterium]
MTTVKEYMDARRKELARETIDCAVLDGFDQLDDENVWMKMAFKAMYKEYGYKSAMIASKTLKFKLKLRVFINLVKDLILAGDEPSFEQAIAIISDLHDYDHRLLCYINIGRIKFPDTWGHRLLTDIEQEMQQAISLAKKTAPE